MNNFLIKATTELNQSTAQEGTTTCASWLNNAVANSARKTVLSEVFKEQVLEMMISLLKYNSHSPFSAFTQG